MKSISWLTVNEAAERLRVDRETIIKWIIEGHLPAVRTPGRRYRIAAEDLHLALVPARDRRKP